MSRQEEGVKSVDNEKIIKPKVKRLYPKLKLKKSISSSSTSSSNSDKEQNKNKFIFQEKRVQVNFENISLEEIEYDFSQGLRNLEEEMECHNEILNILYSSKNNKIDAKDKIERFESSGNKYLFLKNEEYIDECLKELNEL